MSKKNIEQIYCEIIQGLYKLYINKISNVIGKYTDLFELEDNIKINGYWDILDIIYLKFYMLEDVEEHL